ncbi:MAG: beta-hexosaminidase [Clostridia bacterium]|nr:beta-hexosaminidase [Clostridia bacterium]
MEKIISIFMAFMMFVSQFFSVCLAKREEDISAILEKMSLRDKITQMIMMEFRTWDDNTADNVAAKNFTVMNSQVSKIIEDYRFGAVIYFAQNLTSTEQAFNLSVAFQEAATKNDGIPLIICADQEGGSVYRLGSGTALPGNMALGATGSTEYALQAGKIIGSELSAVGINTNLAPVVDVNNNVNNPVIGLRAYSDDAQYVGELAAAMIDGMAKYDVTGCAKHFPGHGDTAVDSHYGLPIVDKSLDSLNACELLPYRVAIDNGISMIMTAHILYPQLENDTIYSQKTKTYESLPATMSDDIITKLLKNEMGFKGIVVTDAMNMSAIAAKWTPLQAVINAINAGVDMICVPCYLNSNDDLNTLDSLLNNLVNAVQNGTIPLARIDDAVKRILTVKYDNNILNWSKNQTSLENALRTVGSSANRESERRISAAAVTVVKNDENTLPVQVSSTSRILMMVPKENQKALMIMGWNRAKQAGLIPDGASLEVVTFSSATQLSTYKTSIDRADTVILNSLVSSAYKMNGGSWESKYIRTVLDYAENAGKTTIVQSVDKPYDVQSYDKADAVVAVYGCKGSTVDPTEALVGGVTSSQAAFGPNITAGIEVMFGVFPASGTLPVNIPQYKNGTFTDTILYNRGYGIHYNSLLS